MALARFVFVLSYHLGVPSLFCSIGEGFRDRLTPVDACAEDVEEDGFQLVRFGHDGVFTVFERWRQYGKKLLDC